MTRSQVRPRAATRRGFTLPEAIATLAILSLLAAFAIANWQRHLQRGWHVQARAAMIDAMLTLQRHALAAGTHAEPGTGRPAGNWPRLVPEPPASPRYRIDARACPDVGLDACVELKARPLRDDGNDASDCEAMVLRSTGEWLRIPRDRAAPLPGGQPC
ncbi:type IV pilin protein [Cupriavidus sp. AU9028]|uniref:type IV pilin protein n=1 Tax=Cupriavidus sp. AU9028 TaxID=2871157 RepID=UPI001C97A625|nr:prepilin-type N-terminal cleavage/methylation domain-containing protein [Cupriavidus sp. AU9028]MBY4898163.1 prepilin-type N-terminal cleavage/methylation domain-containing protein [Cupriavidus sp. AU9028]